MIVVTLLVNALALPGLIRGLGIRGDGVAEVEERAARLATAQAAATAIRQQLAGLKRSGRACYATRSSSSTNAASQRHSANAERRGQVDAVRDAERQLRLAALRAERAELLQLHDSDVINDEVMRTIQSDLDHAESLVARPGRNRE